MELSSVCQQLAALMREAHALAAPYDAQIRALEIARDDACAALTFEIETLQAALRPLLLAEGRTQTVPGLKATVVHKQTWDTETLRAMAQEIPAILQAQRDSSYITFRLTAEAREKVL